MARPYPYQDRRKPDQQAQIPPGRKYRDEATRKLVDYPPGYEPLDYAELIKKAGKMRPEEDTEDVEATENKPASDKHADK